MDAITKGFRDAIANVAGEKLSKYGGKPAIITSRLVPEDVSKPYVYTYGNVDLRDAGTKNSLGREVVRDVNIYARIGDPDVDVIAELLVEAFHRHPESLQFAGYSTLLVEIVGPVVAPTDDTLEGRSLTFRVILTK